jgi:hypothetical protein
MNFSESHVPAAMLATERAAPRRAAARGRLADARAAGARLVYCGLVGAGRRISRGADGSYSPPSLTKTQK